MRLMRLGPIGSERPVVRIDHRHYIDVSAEIADFDGSFFANSGLLRLRALIEGRTHEMVPYDGERVGAPIAKPSRIFCVGLNSRDLARQAGREVPDRPTFSIKSPETLAGPNDPVLIPRPSSRLDWEVEVGVVIGHNLDGTGTLQEAHEAIEGYTLVNDITDRADHRKATHSWGDGKSHESCTPTGPWLATTDEVSDAKVLTMRLEVNDVPRQNGYNAAMIFTPAEIIQHISQTMALQPGDLVCTGTLPGVGISLEPPLWLRDADVVNLSIQGLGSQQQRVFAAN